jgi:hypothetical protein
MAPKIRDFPGKFVHFTPNVVMIDCRVNTNEWRQVLRYVAKVRRPFRKTPLMELGTCVTRHRHGVLDMSRAPTDVLLAAFIHVETRLESLSDNTSRGRKHMRWLGRWQQRINAEINRRRLADKESVR